MFRAFPALEMLWWGRDLPVDKETYFITLKLYVILSQFLVRSSHIYFKLEFKWKCSTTPSQWRKERGRITSLKVGSVLTDQRQEAHRELCLLGLGCFQFRRVHVKWWFVITELLSWLWNNKKGNTDSSLKDDPQLSWFVIMIQSDCFLFFFPFWWCKTVFLCSIFCCFLPVVWNSEPVQRQDKMLGKLGDIKKRREPWVLVPVLLLCEHRDLHTSYTISRSRLRTEGQDTFLLLQANGITHFIMSTKKWLLVVVAKGSGHF